MVSYIWLTSGFVVVRVSPFVVVSSHNTVFSQSPHVVLSDDIFTCQCVLCNFDFGIPAGVYHSSKGPGQSTSHHMTRHISDTKTFFLRTYQSRKRNKKQEE